MPIRCKCFFAGLEVQVSWSMTRSPGVSPDVGQLVWNQNTTQPSAFVGDLVLKNGDTPIVTFTQCMLRNPTERYGAHRTISYQVMDRRWKWKTPTLFGQYNVRDDNNVLVVGTIKTPRELATLALIALGETGYDVSALPTDAEMSPHVFWHYESAAQFLDKLCAMFGCSVHLLNNNTVKIITDNVGTIPDNTGLMYPVQSGLIVNPAPDYITAFAGQTWFESWLTLEAIGTELDGTVKPVEMLSYAPVGGWRTCDPEHGIEQRIWGKLRAGTAKELIEKTVEMAQRQIYRMWRVKGFPPGMEIHAGFTPQTPVGSFGALPATGVEGLFYPVATTGKSKIYTWSNGAYTGISHRNTGATYQIVDISLIAGNTDPVIGSNATLAGAETDRVTLANAKAVIAWPGETVFDPRLILPLLPSRLLTGFDETGKKQNLPAEVCGKFRQTFEQKQRNKQTTALASWRNGIRIDQKLGHVWLGKPAHRYGETAELEVASAEIYLRCGYGFRVSYYGNLYHRQYNLATGNTLGIANGVVNRSDVNEYRIVNYTSDYNTLSSIGSPGVNTSTIDTILMNSATENLKQYQNLTAPERRQYTPYRAIDTNGKVQQVQYEGGLGKFGETIVSIGGQYDMSQPSAYAKRQRDLQQQQTTRLLMTFRSDSEAIVVDDAKVKAAAQAAAIA